jgi:hypothetical protein
VEWKKTFPMISQSLHRHLLLSFRMLMDVIDTCPDALWLAGREKDSIWKRVFHVLESLDFWFDDFSGRLTSATVMNSLLLKDLKGSTGSGIMNRRP